MPNKRKYCRKSIIGSLYTMYAKTEIEQSPRILIVDDDPGVLDLVREQVEYYGFTPIVANSGEEAIRIAEEQDRIDLLLTDVMMPGINGVDLAIKFISLYPDTRVLFMSGYLCPSMAHYGLPDSEYAFVQKPFCVKTLISKIRNILNGPPIPLQSILDA